MCGIAGYYSHRNIFSKDDLEKMTSSLVHRGPDAFGYFTDEVVGLGNRRLSILDLSANGNQPMHSHNNRYVISYNGEIYNFPDVANELKLLNPNANINFNSSSDTEVILEAFAYWGLDFVEKLNGMFAIALYDKQEQEIYLIRDRLGIKPVYYYWNGQDFAFASELKALNQLKNIPKVINHDAVYYFLNVGFIPAPFSIYSDIKKLLPGTILHVSKNKINHHRYWNPKKQIKENVIDTEKKAMVEMSDLLASSIQYQMKSDVPFGVFLSGGTDSSLITAQAVNLSTVKLNTFSIGFKESRYNEATYARTIANYLRTNHYEFIVSYNDAIELIDKMMVAYDEPYADSSAIPTMLVSKLARKYVTVALSGDGGDELFLGYGAYKWAKRLSNPISNFLRHEISGSLSKFGNKYKRAAKLFEYNDEHDINSHILSQEQYFFSQKELDKLLLKPFKNKIGNIFDISHWSYKRVLNEMEKQALFDLNYYLPDDLLVKVDRATMQYSLEARVPYLDHRIVEFALNLSPNLKCRNGTTKYLLKEILYQYVPEKLLNRPKQGFAIPLNIWLRKELKYLIDDYLSESIIKKHGIVDYAIVNQLKQNFFSGTDYVYNRLWLLIVLHKWFEKNSH